MNIKKGDNVKIISGKDRGKTGAVLRIFVADERVAVEGLNLYKKRIRPKQQGQKGETISAPRPMHVSNIMIVCSSCKKPTRIGYRYESDSKIRYCKKCKASI